MPDTLSIAQMTALDKAFGFTKTGNSEIAAEWFILSIQNGYTQADPAIEQFLIRVGRRKFLTPIYGALIKTDAGKQRALEIYAKARPNYHSVSINTLDEMLNYSM